MHRHSGSILVNAIQFDKSLQEHFTLTHHSSTFTLWEKLIIVFSGRHKLTPKPIIMEKQNISLPQKQYLSFFSIQHNHSLPEVQRQF
jgi:hypothetical protein